MPIAVVCPSCNQRLNAPDAAAGKALKCPACSSRVPIPAPAAVLVPSQAQPSVVDYSPPEPLPPDFEDDRPGEEVPRRKKRESFRLTGVGTRQQSVPLIFEVFGGLALVSGLLMSTTVSSESSYGAVHNIGLIAHKELCVLGGLGSLALATLFRIRLAIEERAKGG